MIGKYGLHDDEGLCQNSHVKTQSKGDIVQEPNRELSPLVLRNKLNR